MHPEQEKAIQRQQQVAEERLAMKETIANAINQDIRFVFVPIRRLTPGHGYQPDIHGHGTTIAYRVVRKDVIEISTAISHPDDKPTKLAGRFFATINFFNGSTVMVRRHDHKQPIRRMLETMFAINSYVGSGNAI